MLTKVVTPASEAASTDTVRRWVLLDAPEGVPILTELGRADQALSGFAQTAAFAEHWARNTGAELVVLVGYGEEDRVLTALPLQIEGRFGTRHAAFCGDSHANSNFPMIAGPLTDISDDELRQAFVAAKIDVDLVDLRRMAPESGGVANPFCGGRTSVSADPALVCDMRDGFDQLLQRHSGKRQRKKHRQDRRNLDALGTLDIVAANEPEQAERFLSTLFAQKASRFAALGVTDNPFGHDVQRFFITLAKDQCSAPDPVFEVRALILNDEPIAIASLARLADRVVCEFSSFQPLEGSISPGIFLFYEIIEAEAAKGTAFFDFSVGDEPFKRDWSDADVILFDRVVPVTAKGRAVASWLKAERVLRRTAKRYPAARRIMRSLRRSSPKR